MLLFDTGKKLEKAFTQEQFDALVEVLENRQDRIAGKDDLRKTELRLQLEIEKVRAETEKLRAQMETTRAELKRDIETTKAELKADIAQLRLDTTRDLREMEMRMLLKLGGLICASAGLIVALQKIFL